MPVERVSQSNNTPIVGATPTWLYYGDYAGVNRMATSAPAWRNFGSSNVYAFTPWLQDRQQGALWIADFGALASPRYRHGSIRADAKSFLMVSGGVLVDSYPTAGTFTTEALSGAASASALTKVPGVTGLYVVQEGSPASQKWSQVGAVSFGTFGVDEPYNQQFQWWGDGVVAAGADLTVLRKYVSWPTDTGFPQEPFAEGGVTYVPNENTIRTENDTGPAQVRRRTTAMGGVLSFQLFLSPENHAILEGFYNNTLNQTQKFSWKDYKTGAAAVYRFKMAPSYEWVAADERSGSTDNRHWWRTSITLDHLPG